MFRQYGSNNDTAIDSRRGAENAEVFLVMRRQRFAYARLCADYNYLSTARIGDIEKTEDNFSLAKAPSTQRDYYRTALFHATKNTIHFAFFAPLREKILKQLDPAGLHLAKTDSFVFQINNVLVPLAFICGPKCRLINVKVSAYPAPLRE